jgi:7-cyano-7-deazaguanine synthase
MERAVALLSGGLDSGVAAAVWVAAGGAIAECLTCTYGQQAWAQECVAAERLAARLRAPWRAIDLPWLAEASRLAGSALTAPGADLPRGTLDQPGDAHSAAAVWVPARNAVFIAMAAACAEARGATVVLAGFNREEAATFPDNSAAFVAAADRLLALGTRNGVRVESPTLAWDKRRIAQEARKLELGPEDFWSCYRSGTSPCGSCESCLRSARAWT